MCLVIAFFVLCLFLADTTLIASLEQLFDQIEKVGQSLWRSPFYIFRTLTLPAILPGVAAAFALVFLNLMKELTATLLLTSNDIKTLSIAVWEHTSDSQLCCRNPLYVNARSFSGIPVFLLKKYAFK